MVNKILLKETKNFIKKNIKTYIAQVIIIMLGVGFFIGMKVASIDLQNTMTTFIEDNNFYDLKINLEYGIEDQDIEKLKEIIKEVKYMEGAYSADIVSNFNDKDYVVRLHSYNPNKKINTVQLKEGKLPSNNQECVIDSKMQSEGFYIGDKITINHDMLNEKEMTIVGVIQSPEYLAIDRGNSTLLSGKINYYIYIYEDNINSDLFSELYIKYDTKFLAFTDEYNEYIEKKEIEATYEVSGYFKDKYNEIIINQERKIAEAKAEYEVQKADVESQISQAESNIANLELMIEIAKEGLLTKEEIDEKVSTSVNEGLSEIKVQLDLLKKEMDSAKAEYDNYKNKYGIDA